MKVRVFLISAALVAVALAAFLVGSSFFSSRSLILEKGRGLPKNQSILIKTKVEGFGVQKGDAFSYVVEVWYDPNQVSEIDRTALEKSLNWKPFEIRGAKESEFQLDGRTRLYQREYELQLIDGKVDYLYKFPTLVVRYRLKGSEGFLEKTAVPEAIYVAPRLPANIKGLELKPITEKIQDGRQENLPWILWGLGGVLALLGVFDLAWRVIPTWKESRKQRRTAEGVDVLSEAYGALHRNIEKGVEAKSVLHQMDRILRIVLARKEKGDWLNGFNPDGMPSEIKESVLSFFAKSEKAYRPEDVEKKETDEALSQLQRILIFYFGKREVEAWRR